MKILLTGCEGQAGHAVYQSAPEWADVERTDLATLDICDRKTLLEFVSDLAPEVIVNAAAYTDVDKAEEDFDTAVAVNGTAVKNLVDAARAVDARIVHISTDYVFGDSTGRALKPSDPANPKNVYARTKLDGERHVLERTPGSGVVLRTSWLYSPHGNNFVLTMLRLMASRPQLSVVSDQIGAPTSSTSLAAAIWAAVEKELSGLYHWRDAGVASWYDFAIAIFELGSRAGLISQTVDIRPIPSHEYPTAAVRPAFSLLDTFESEKALGIQAANWRENLSKVLDEIAHRSRS